MGKIYLIKRGALGHPTDGFSLRNSLMFPTRSCGRQQICLGKDGGSADKGLNPGCGVNLVLVSHWGQFLSSIQALTSKSSLSPPWGQRLTPCPYSLGATLRCCWCGKTIALLPWPLATQRRTLQRCRRTGLLSRHLCNADRTNKAQRAFSDC